MLEDPVELPSPGIPVAFWFAALSETLNVWVPVTLKRQFGSAVGLVRQKVAPAAGSGLPSVAITATSVMTAIAMMIATARRPGMAVFKTCIDPPLLGRCCTRVPSQRALRASSVPILVTGETPRNGEWR